MATLDEIFTRYGYPADEMNERIYFCFRRADKIETFDRVQQADKDAQDKITSVVIWHPKGKRPETYSQWGKEDAQSLIDFYDFAEDDTTVFDADGNKVTSEFAFDK